MSSWEVYKKKCADQVREECGRIMKIVSGSQSPFSLKQVEVVKELLDMVCEALPWKEGEWGADFIKADGARQETRQ